jgi:hypothetical protein
MFDDWYEQFLKLTKRTKEKDCKEWILSMHRFIKSTGEEYIVYAINEYKQDPLGNPKSFYRGNMGMYPILQPLYEIKVDPEQGYDKVKVLQRVEVKEVAYSIPFNKHREITKVHLGCPHH